MKSYVINLDRSPERLAAFTAQAAKAGIAFERFAAIDGKFVPAAELRAHLADRFEFQPINVYEIALFLSHRALWQKLVDSGDACCAIFEDDVVLSAQTAKAFGQLEATTMRFDVAKLETTTRKVIIAKEAVAVGDGFSLSVLKSWHGGAAAYVLSRQGAEKLLEQTVKVADPVDQVIFDPISKIARTLHRLQLVPAVAIQMQFYNSQEQSDAFVSTVGRQETASKLIRHGLGIDLQRMMKRLYSSLARRLQAANPVNIYRQIPFADEAVAAAGQN